MKLWVLLPLLGSLLLADYSAKIFPIDSGIKKRMIRGGSYRPGCPVPLRDLNYLRMTYRGFDGKDHTGEMIVHKDVAEEVTRIFGELYRAKYPIRRMRLVSDYGGSDWRSIEADNTTAFNCRKATGSGRWSKHSFGKAIDINPIENPYIRPNGHISHKASYPFKIRKHRKNNSPADRAMIIPGDKAQKIFSKYGWRWGAYFREAKDLQHFYHP